MKSVFGSKRKARKIQVDNEEDADSGTNHASIALEQGNNAANTTESSSNLASKPFKKSALLPSTTAGDILLDQDDSAGGVDIKGNGFGENKSSIGRSASTKKKPKASSRLSFGPGNDAAETLQGEEIFTPKKSTLERRVIESNALRQSLPVKKVTLRDNDEDEDRPKYSKDYLNELKSSTPSKPNDLGPQVATVEDEGTLDASEIEGATVVTTEERPAASSSIPTDTEIREKKERRARLAHEQDFISLNDTNPIDGGRQLSLLPRKQKPESRLVRDDEDFAEGFEEFIDDGRISLGKKQEREAKRKQRKEMAAMIQQAEGGSSDEEASDDSEAERRAAYESAQTRAGMDGLARPDKGEEAASQIPSKITPLPVLSERLKKLQETLSGMEKELNERKQRKEELEKEKADIAAREVEVQGLLKRAGEKYGALNADASMSMVGDVQAVVDRHGAMARRMTERGLESLGTTPAVSGEVMDVG